MKKVLILYVLLLPALFSKAQYRPWSQRMAATAMHLWPDSLPNGKWAYEQGVLLQGMQSVWQQTGDGNYFKYIQHHIDRYVTSEGAIRTYNAGDYNLDNVLSGRSLLTLYQVLNTEKYSKAAALIYQQLKQQPRNNEGGFWHKQRYPDQMWLDGLYMAEPFYATYARIFHHDADLDDVANQFILIEQHARGPKTGLLYHAWDASGKEHWANSKTGLSANFWGRADGWFAMALVDVLDQFPASHPKRPALLAILNRLASAIQTYQDKKSGVWYQVLDKGGQKGNYLEASASCMFVYALAKGAREGYLPKKYLSVAKRGYQGIINQFVRTGAEGTVNLTGICGVAGLGGNPYRDGSYTYYISEKPVTNDPKGIGAFILASVEIERLTRQNAGNGKIVLLDSYFNDEHKKDITGAIQSFHYKWDELPNSGFSSFGYIFNNYGFRTQTLYAAPNDLNLAKASVYIIVDADIPKENPNTKYILEPHIKAIANWVKRGGVLIVLNNDTGNAEFKHVNKLMARFGIRFNENSVNHVINNQFEQGAINIDAGNMIFKTARKVYIKELSTIAITPPAVPALIRGNDIIVAIARYGKGTIFAAGDPWFYNEYLDGRKLPPEYENFKAANDLVAWISRQIPSKQ